MAEVRRLLVDARPVDHPTARGRGIGRYTLGLLAGLKEVGAPVVALFSTQVEADLLRAALPGVPLAPWNPDTIRTYTAPGTWYLATQLMLHPIPLDPVPSIISRAGLPVAAVMYDVIPERHPEQYQVRATARAQVQVRGVLTRTLDALLSISEFAADTASVELRFPRGRIATIGAGVEATFSPPTDDPWPRLRRLMVPSGRAPVVVVAGADPRKNVENMVTAWGLLPPSLRATHRLVLVGGADATVIGTWQRWIASAGLCPEDLLLTGMVTDEEMVAALQVAALAVMPSTEEGFGLPVLEAAACGCPVITSAVSSLPEVLAHPPATFDPFQAKSIASAVERALTDAVHREDLCAAGRRAVQKWTWANTGIAVMDSLARLGPSRPRTLHELPLRIGLAGTFDDSPGGHRLVALADALERSSRPVEVHRLVDWDGSPIPTGFGHGRLPVRAVGRYAPTSQYDHLVAVLQPGNLATEKLVTRERTHVWLADPLTATDAVAHVLAGARSVMTVDEASLTSVNSARPGIASTMVSLPETNGDGSDAAAEALVRWLVECATAAR